MKTTEIKVRNGLKQWQPIEAVWVGQNLAVHRPLGLPAAEARGRWTISHLATGRRLCAWAGSQAGVIGFARQWDTLAGAVTVENANDWSKKHGFVDAWRAAGQSPDPQKPAKPRKPGSQPDGEQFPVEPCIRRKTIRLESGETVDVLATGSIRIDRKNIRRSLEGTAELYWRGEWWEVPACGQVMSWTFDSVCETPDGRTVEHDAPDSWLRLLGLV